MQSRIELIRMVVGVCGGKVVDHYANGPGTVNGFPRGDSRVRYKVITSGGDVDAMVSDLNGTRFDIERSYKSRSGYLTVVFKKRARL